MPRRSASSRLGEWSFARRRAATDMVSFYSGGDGAYSDPYRLYNLDVFEYDADSEMAIVSHLARVTALSHRY